MSDGIGASKVYQCNRCGEPKSWTEISRKSRNQVGDLCLDCLRASGTKVCTACDTEKYLRDFHVASHGAFGVTATCRDCNSERAHARIHTYTCRSCGNPKIRSDFPSFRREFRFDECKDCYKVKGLRICQGYGETIKSEGAINGRCPSCVTARRLKLNGGLVCVSCDTIKQRAAFIKKRDGKYLTSCNTCYAATGFLYCKTCGKLKNVDQFVEKDHRCFDCEANRSAEYRKGLSIPEIKRRKRKGMYLNARMRAERDSIPFSLLEQDVHFLFEKHTCCQYCGTDFLYTNSAQTKDTSPTLDKFHPHKGYVIGNIFAVCHRCNRLKSDASVEEIVHLGAKLQEISKRCSDV